MNLKIAVLVSIIFVFIPAHLKAQKTCKYKASSFIGDNLLGDITKNAKKIKTRAKVSGFLDEFLMHYKNIFSFNNFEASKYELKQIKKWTERIVKELDDTEKVLLIRALRREFLIFIRDSSKGLSEITKKKLDFFENIFSNEAPFLLEAFCFDAEFLLLKEKSTAFEEKMIKVKEIEKNIEAYSKDLEGELRENIKNDPALSEHWYNYAMFLFSSDRIKEADEFLSNMIKRFPYHDRAKKLKNYCVELSKIDDSLIRSKKIEAYVSEEREQTFTSKKQTEKQ